jgi:outer membrane protein insertion porin family
LTHQYFQPLSKTLTLALSGEIDTGDGYGGKPLPFFKNYYSGGIGSVRGYRPASLGPRDPDGTFVGGNRKINGSAEFLFPFPGSADRSMRLGAFWDTGQVYGPDEKMDLSLLRSAYGISFAWNSPIGPMKFSMAWPTRVREGDSLQRFQFVLGTTF